MYCICDFIIIII